MEALKVLQEERIHWMATVNLIYRLGGIEKERVVNVLVRTINPYLNQASLQSIQQQAQIQAREYNKIPKKAEIIDVIISVSMLGTMTDAQFAHVPTVQVELPEVSLEPDTTTN